MPTKQPPAPPNTRDLVLFQGTSLIVEITVGGVGSIAAAQIAMRVKAKASDPDVQAVLSKRTGTGITVTAPGDSTTPGAFQIKFDPADTQSMAPGSYEYDIKMQLGSDVFMVVERSHFDVELSVTQSV